jgi:hypothetical protein
MKKYPMIAVITIVLSVSGYAPSGDEPKSEVKSRAYVGHENDRDIHNFIRQYPDASGTRLDDCQTCHRGGLAGTDTQREYSPCGYCHLLEFPNPRYTTGVPGGFEDTLNAFGLSYKRAGRTVEALSSIGTLDSDADGFSNAVEIADKRYPGDAASRPGQLLAPTVTLDRNRIFSLPKVTQFMLMNTTQEPFDDYTSYSGVRIKDVLDAAGADLKGTTGITVFAPDGYSVDYSIDDCLKPFPKGYFYAAPGMIREKEKRFVRYPESVPPDLRDGGEIPETPWLLLAFERDGAPLEISHYEKGSGRLVGEGPYRLIRPLRDLTGDPSRPGRPDRSVKSPTYGDGWDYVKSIDHNAGACVRGATVIRLNPMPEGYEEYDWKNGWTRIDSRQIVIFGNGVGKPK